MSIIPAGDIVPRIDRQSGVVQRSNGSAEVGEDRDSGDGGDDGGGGRFFLGGGQKVYKKQDSRIQDLLLWLSYDFLEVMDFSGYLVERGWHLGGHDQPFLTLKCFQAGFPSRSEVWGNF